MLGQFLFDLFFIYQTSVFSYRLDLVVCFACFELLRVFSAQFFIHERKRHGLTTDKQTPSSQSVSRAGLLRIFCAIFFIHKRKK